MISQHELVVMLARREQAERVAPEEAGQRGNVVNASGLRDGELHTAIFMRPQALSKHLPPSYRVTRPLSAQRAVSQTDTYAGDAQLAQRFLDCGAKSILRS
jgi:hypothetical protein